MSNWIRYDATGDDYVPIEQFGRDHWSTFGYLETCTVDKRGLIDNARMRCNTRLHRDFAESRGFGVIDGSQYPTRLKDGTIDRHDDWSCAEDAVAAGLIELEWREKDESELGYNSPKVGGCKARVRLTERGRQIAAQLRAHKANGGTFATFTPREAAEVPQEERYISEAGAEFLQTLAGFITPLPRAPKEEE